MTKEPVPPCVHNTPACKIALRDALYGIVYERTHERFNELLTDIREKNRLTCSYSWDGFTHRGVYYGQSIPKMPLSTVQMTRVQMAKYKASWHQMVSNRRNQKLDATLVPAMDQLLAEREEVEQGEGTMVRTILGTILNSAQAVGDYKRLLPSLLHLHLTEVEAECSCVVPRLTDAQVDAIKAKHERYISLIQKRQLIYLLTP